LFIIFGLRLNEQEQKIPDLLPYGYLVGDHTSIILKLKDAAQNALDFLCYDTLVPKSVMQRYVSLLLDFKNLLFCGPNGTNKSYIARKIAEHLVKRHNKSIETSIAYLNVENKSSKELKQYLNNIVELPSPDQIPFVLILDNLHFISNVSDTFTEYFSPKNSARKCTYIIGTLNQPNVTSLNLHPNFKWVLCLNHTEPVKSFLNRHLQRRLIDNENKGQISAEMEGLISWIPKLWSHVNKYIELYNSPDMTLGPKLFLTFPMDMRQAQNWFIHLWNELLVPLLIDIIKEGVQVYGPKVKWEDPKNWLKKTLPWNLYDPNVIESLYSIDSHHVGYESIDGLISNELLESNQIILEESKPIELPNQRKLEVPKSLQLVSYPNSPAKVNQFTTFGRSLNTDSLTNELHPKENDKLFNMLVKLQEATLSQKS
jgi:neuron navigator 2